MRLVEAGELSPDAPITDYLPDYPTQRHAVTVRHLLNHTSGIKSYTGLGHAFGSKQRLDLSEAELVDLFDDLEYDFEPGAEYRHNNSAYYLLGVIIGKATGTPGSNPLTCRPIQHIDRNTNVMERTPTQELRR
jgi:D-alanyl-D-alanine carboxypeptidase